MPNEHIYLFSVTDASGQDTLVRVAAPSYEAALDALESMTPHAIAVEDAIGWY